MRRLLERFSGLQHLLLAFGTIWLIVTSPWIGMRRIVPENATFWDYSHVGLGIVVTLLAICYLATQCVGGRWRQHWPWLVGRIRPAGRDLAGLFRGRIPPSGGDGLFPMIQGLALLLLVAASTTGSGWLIADGSRAALAWREWHIVSANAFAWILLLHALAGAAHVLELRRA
jgi:hypothetical protein